MQPRTDLDLPRTLGRDALAASTRTAAGLTLWAERDTGGRERLAVAAADATALMAFHGDVERSGDHLVLRGPAAANAAALRAALPNLRPTPLGLRMSAGFGDRLGLATPGHVAALRATGAEERIAPIFAQQSVRENARTGRTPLEVLDDATIGAFAAGWGGAVGADADHLKNETDVDAHLEAGFSFFTIDPGEHVAADADALEGGALQEAFEQRPPWEALATTPADLRQRLGALRVDLGDRALVFAPGELERAAVKYGAALVHVARLARHLRGRAGPDRAELEVSVDETDTPTSPAEHAYLAIELRRLGVDWVSLAPRFVGAFEKGIDYLGDLGALARDLDGHARVADALGPYKLSLHSGSDKFAVYPIAAAVTGGRVHLKTAGTSYLEALRVAGRRAPDLLHDVVRLGLERFAEDVHSYHISGRPERMPDVAALPGSAALALLEQTDARQVLHVTFGSALRVYGERLRAVLRAHPDDYEAGLRRHFERHLAPFVAAAGGGAAAAGTTVTPKGAAA
jgi:tagaturonate epimerase